MRTKLLVVLVAALALSAMLLAGDVRAQRTARQGNDNASGGGTKRVVGVRSSDTGNGSRVTITADDSLKDYSAYRSGDRFYVVLPKSAAGGARGGGAGKGYSDMQVQQRGDSVVLSYRVQPGAKPRVEQRFNRLDVVFDVPGGDAAQQAAAANNNAHQQQQQQTPPAENRAAQQNEQRPAAANTPGANPTPERRQPTAEEAARAQAANAAAANTTPPAVTTGQPTVGVDTAAQNPASASVAPTQEPAAAASPTAEPQVAQAQQPTTVAPITTNQPAAATQTGSSLGTFLIRNWALALVFALIVVGLGLVVAARRTAAQPAPVEGLEEESKTKPEESRATRAKEATTRALKDAPVAAQPSTLDASKAATAGKAEPVSKAGAVGTAETVNAAEASGADVKPLVGAAALAGGAAVAKSKKQSKKEARQEAKRKKKGRGVEEPARAEAPAIESEVAAPIAQETAAAEPAVEVPAVAETAAAAPVVAEAAAVEPVAEETLIREESAVETPPVEQAAAAEETAEPEQLEVAEPSLEIAAAAVVASEVETTEIAPVEAETAEPFVAEAEAPAPVTEIEPAFAPEPEHVLNETHNLLEGDAYNRAVVGSRDAMARQMVAAELLAALASRNPQRRQRAGAAFVEHGYFDETARDLREADAPAERSAAARSLAILGDRKATPLLVAALEDPVLDVRRAAVEALGALRDPSAVAPLEALLEREKNERNRIPPRVIRTAVEFCREGFEQTPVAATQTVVPVEAAAVETAPEPVAEVAAPETAEETSSSITPFVDESFAAEPVVAQEPAAEATGELAHVPEPVRMEGTFETVVETGVEPFVNFEEETAVAEEVGIEPVVERDEEVTSAGTFDFETGQHESGQAALFDTGAEEATREIEPVAADASKELTPATGEVAAGEWFDFDYSEMGGEAQPASSATPATGPATTESLSESSSGEALAASAAAELEEGAPAAETQAEATRDIEVAGHTAEAPPVLRGPAPAHADEPAAEAREKGIAPLDESSTVPAAIQQRIASRDPQERAAAIVELSHVDTDEAFHQICAAFDDRSEEVRAAAARALYELRHDRAESFTRALREATPERRREVGAAIASSGLAAESISQLTGESRERTYEAFSLLFLMAKAGEVQPLLRAIEGHPSNEVRLAVVKLLALSGQKEVLPAFRRLAVRGSLPTEVRSAVMEAIYQISSSQPTPA